MRSIKLSVTVAASLATLCIAGSAFADPPVDTSTTTSTTTTTAPAPQPVMTAPPPAVVPNADGSMPASTSTTTTTSADTERTTAPAAPDQVIYQKHTPSKAWLITGGALLAGTYVTTAAVAAGNGSIGDKDLYIPIAGPWIDLASRSWSNTRTTDTVLIMGSGILQGVGAGMAVASFFIPEKTAVATIHAKAGPVDMDISPSAGGGLGGLAAVGTF